MQDSLRRVTTIKTTSLVFISVVTIVAFAVNVRKLTSRILIPANAKITTTNVAAPLQSSNQKTIEVVVVTLSPNGFFPKEVVFPKKKFILALNNRTGESSLLLNLFRDKTNKLQEKPLKNETMSLQWELDLASGNYELRELNHPNWVLTLTDTKK